MNSPISCFSSKTYISNIDEYTGAITEIQLNFFQRFLRFLGLYSETHLEKLEPLAQKVVMMPDYKEVERIKELLRKTYRNYNDCNEHNPLKTLDDLLRYRSVTSHEIGTHKHASIPFIFSSSYDPRSSTISFKIGHELKNNRFMYAYVEIQALPEEEKTLKVSKIGLDSQTFRSGSVFIHQASNVLAAKAMREMVSLFLQHAMAKTTKFDRITLDSAILYEAQHDKAEPPFEGLLETGWEKENMEADTTASGISVPQNGNYVLKKGKTLPIFTVEHISLDLLAPPPASDETIHT